MIKCLLKQREVCESPEGVTSQTSLDFREYLITNFPHVMVLLIINGRNKFRDSSQERIRNRLISGDGGAWRRGGKKEDVASFPWGAG